MENIAAERLRRRLLAYAIGAMVLLAGVVAAVSIIPLADRLTQAQHQALVHTLDQRVLLVEEYLARARNVAAQITSRSRIRQELARYNEGVVDLEGLVRFSEPKLRDALQLSPELWGITRADAEGTPVIVVGIAAPEAIWPPLPTSGPVVGEPVVLEGQALLPVAAPIVDRQGAVQGTDIILFSLGRLHRIAADPNGLGRTGQVTLLAEAGQGKLTLIHDGAGESHEPDTPFGRALAAAREAANGMVDYGMVDYVGPDGETWIVAVRAIPGADWWVAIRAAANELNRSVDAVIFNVLLVVALAVVIGAVGLVVLLHPLTGRILVGARDLSEQVRDLEKTRAALEHQTRELLRSNQDLERFAHMASHDLREPLRTMTSYAQLLARRHGPQLDEDGRQFLDFIIDAAARMQRLITDLLAYSRAVSRPRRNGTTPLEPVVRVTLEDLGARIAETGALISVGDMATVPMERDAAIQLLENLIANALKYRAPDRRCRINVFCETGTDDVRIQVCDNGIGIAPDQITQIFQPFHRLHGRELPGTGVGLAICKHLVEQAGGTIDVESTPDQGSCFRVHLPSATLDSQGDPTLETGSSADGWPSG